MSNLVLWSVIVGFFLPLVIAVIHQPRFPEWVGVVITVVVSGIAGVVTTAIEGNLDLHNASRSVLIVLVAAIAFYKGAWNSTAKAIKEKTAVKGPA